MSYNTLIVDVDDGAGVGLIRLNRKEQRNALNSELMDELCRVLDEWESDKDVRCVILTGTEKVFAAGADIVEMRGKSFPEVYKDDFVTKNWERLTVASTSGRTAAGGRARAMPGTYGSGRRLPTAPRPWKGGPARSAGRGARRR